MPPPASKYISSAVCTARTSTPAGASRPIARAGRGGWGFAYGATKAAQIALARRSSVSTVANQVASVFRKCGVFSRGELMAMMA